MNKTITIEDHLIDTVLQKTHSLILHNDSHNNMEDIANNLMEICHHTPEQAEQVMIIAHSKGCAEAKRGEYDDLALMQEKFSSRHITTTIEEND